MASLVSHQAGSAVSPPYTPGEPPPFSDEGGPLGLTVICQPPVKEHRLDIVLVYGMKGGSRSTPLNRDPENFCPLKLLPVHFPCAHVITFGYIAQAHP